MVATATSAAPQRRYYLRFGASKLEADLEGNFLTRGGTLGGAAARGETDFALTYADHSTPHLLTERHELVQIPLSDTLVQASQALFAEETGGAQFEVNGDVPVLLLSDRTQLLLTSLRTGASINGTLVYSMSGTASVPLHSLFATVDASALVKSSGCNVEQMLGVTTPPFAQIPIKYPNWDAINATIGVNAARRVTMDENCVEIPVNVAFFTPGKLAARMQAVEPVLKSVYDVSWKKTETVPFAPSAALTKSVTRKAYGFNGSHVQPGLRGQRHAASAPAETLESVMAAALEFECQGAPNHNRLLSDLARRRLRKRWSTPSRSPTRCGALRRSPCRTESTARQSINPGGVSMVQAESWPTEPVRVFGATADDCDGSAGCQISLVRFATNLNADPNVDMSRFPNLRAVANSLGAHYVYGTAVLAANAGHAAAANEAATTVAGHAIMLRGAQDKYPRGARARRAVDGRGRARGRVRVRARGHRSPLQRVVSARPGRADARRGTKVLSNAPKHGDVQRQPPGHVRCNLWLVRAPRLPKVRSTRTIQMCARSSRSSSCATRRFQKASPQILQGRPSRSTWAPTEHTAFILRSSNWGSRSTRHSSLTQPCASWATPRRTCASPR